LSIESIVESASQSVKIVGDIDDFLRHWIALPPNLDRAADGINNQTIGYAPDICGRVPGIKIGTCFWEVDCAIGFGVEIEDAHDLPQLGKGETDTAAARIRLPKFLLFMLKRQFVRHFFS